MQPSIVIRDIDSITEMHRVEELQKEVWGIPDIEVVPLSQLVAVKHAGGVLLGAFDGEAIVGFAYGFVGQEEGRVVHHSHMVGVRSEYRAHDVGFRLKAAQRERVLGQGITSMSWTFDPLQSLNAYFNFGKLGVIADRYFVDFYGSGGHSFLHRNGTDRLWLTWELTSDRVVERLRKEASMSEPSGLSTFVECGENDRPIRHDLGAGLLHDVVAIEIPADISAIEQADKALAIEWREATRNAFTKALANGFFVEDFYRQFVADRQIGTYVLHRKKK